MEVSNDLPLFYNIMLSVPLGSQLFGDIPNPDNEVQLWKSHREKLESTMVMFPGEFIAETCVSWLRSYAGHYIPSVTSRVHRGNKDSEGLPINLKGFSIGNGLTNPEIQYKAYTDYALEMGLKHTWIMRWRWV